MNEHFSEFCHHQSLSSRDSALHGEYIKVTGTQTTQLIYKEDIPMAITPHDIAKMLDHSTLQPFLTEEDIRKGCELALKYDCASVCARPCDVPILAEMLKGSDVKVCTVIGFPHGSHETVIKVAEAELALAEGCTELDMVINIGKMIAGDTVYVKNEIKLLADAAHAKGAILKVILETCYLTDEQKITCCKLAEEAPASLRCWLRY